MIPNIHMFIIIITLSGVCSFLYSANLQSQEALGNPSTHALNKNWNPDQQKAIEIADQELLKHFPDKKKFEITYEVISVIGHERPSNTLNQLYTVIYDLPLGPTDQSITILVDITDKKIIGCSPHME